VNAGASPRARRTFDDRHWRIRGLEKQLGRDRLRVNLRVARRELTHVETLDLYVACRRRAFLREAADELYVEQALLKRDLGHVLWELEQRQERLIRRTLARQEVDVPPLTEAQRNEALELLQDPRLMERVLEDYEARGQTQHYEVEGPVAMLLTTTAQHPDEELANRCPRFSTAKRLEPRAQGQRRSRATLGS